MKCHGFALTVAGGLALSLSFMAGCGNSKDNDGLLSGGISRIPDVAPSSAESRQEFEVVSNAQLKRQDTRPRWPLGTFVYKKGVDRLLVISNITSYQQRKDEDPDSAATGPRFDKWVERVWITIPFDTPVGKSLDLNRLEQDHLVGYDRGDVEEGAMLIHPQRVLGRVTILEERDDAVVVDLDLSVTIRSFPGWKVKTKTVVPVSDTGVRASAAKTLATTDVAVKTDDPDKKDDNPDNTGADNKDDPAIAKADQKDEEKEATAKLVGQWTGDLPGFDLLFQFDEDGKFVYASRREGDVPPSMKYGTWKVRGDLLILYVKRYEISGVNHMRFLDQPMMILHQKFNEEEKLVISGDMRDREGVIRMTADRGDFPNMNKNMPPNGNAEWKKAAAATDAPAKESSVQK